MADPTLVCSIGEDSKCGIQKKVLHAGKEESDFPHSTKVFNRLFINQLIGELVCDDIAFAAPSTCIEVVVLKSICSTQ